MKLIDKDTLVGEINRLQEVTMDKNQNFLSSYHEGIFDGLSMLENFLDTLEVKGVDLEKEIKEAQHNYKVDNNQHTSICAADIEWIAEHFFELGLKLNKGE